MNRSILILICDFLLISVLALVNVSQPINTQPTQATQAAAAPTPPAEGVVAETLQASLEVEAAQRAALQAELAEREAALAQRLEELDRTQAEREALAAQRQEAEEARRALETKVGQTQEELRSLAQERESLSANLEDQQRRQRELHEQLQARLSELSEAREAVANLSEERSRLAEERQRLSTEVQIKETERRMLGERLTAAEAQIEVARVERERAVSLAENLGTNVGQLAEQSQAIRQEIKEATPLSANEIYARFERGLMVGQFTGRLPAVFGTIATEFSTPVLLVRDGGGVYALFSVAGTPLAPAEVGRVRELSGRIVIGNRALTLKEVSYVQADPRVAVAAVPEELVGDQPVFELAENPLQFTEVLVAGRPGNYGTLSTRLQAGGGYLSMRRSLVQRAFGDFTPQTRDFVFSLSGALIGVMIDGERAAIVPAISPREHLALGDGFSTVGAEAVSTTLRGRLPTVTP